MLAFLSLTAAYLGFCALALSMQRHAPQLLASKLSSRARGPLRIGGWLLLATSALPAVAVWGLSIGLSAWAGILTVAAFALGMVLTMTEHGVSRRVAYVPALAGTAAMISALILR